MILLDIKKTSPFKNLWFYCGRSHFLPKISCKLSYDILLTLNEDTKYASHASTKMVKKSVKSKKNL